MSAVKEKAHTLIDNLSETDTWDDLMYKIYVTKQIEKGLDDIANDRVVSHAEVVKRFVG
jgi:hypothetical protein